MNKNDHSITPEEVYKLAKDNSKCTILDVRTPWEHSKEHIKNAENIDCSDPDFKEELLKLDRDQKYIVYCKSGIRGQKVAELMKKNGFIDVLNLEGGIEKWKKKNLPVMR